MRKRLLVSSVWLACLALATVAIGQGPKTKDGFVTTADGVRIHYIEAGSEMWTGKIPSADSAKGSGPIPIPMSKKPAILFVPGWTMPAWIWEHQIAHFAKNYRVVAMDPRSQGESSQESEGLYPAARARDVKAVIDQLKLAPVVLVGWSMGVTEVVAYIEQFGTEGIAGIVLVDGTAGRDFDATSTPRVLEFASGFQKDRRKATEGFVKFMYRKPQTEEYLKRVTEAALRTPTNSAVALFLGNFTADHRAALPKIDKPTLVLAAGDDQSNPWMKYYRDMADHIPGARLEQFPGCGHALFVDDPARFNSLLGDFLGQLHQSK